MNDKKICFISCVNDHELYREALFYINHLEVPEDYEIECVSIENSKSMAHGYNEAMKVSDAKYKVYMHQDVFIRNRLFIRDILRIFKRNDDIGMIGVIGSRIIPTSGVWLESSSKCGKVFDSHTGEIQLWSFGDVQGEYDIVQAIDGLIIVTQYDIPWREDIFDGWYFYDISQCVEFGKKGYKVAVPRQEKPWVIHDCGIVNVRNGYEYYRKIFLNEYSKSIFPLVSILIPTYNRPKYFKLALESVLSQTYKNLEIIVGDDSTNNDTEEIIKHYLAKYPEIKYYHNEKNLGQFDNDLKLLDMAQGEYINFLMDDDLFEPTKIEKMMNYFVHDENEEISLVTSHRGIIDENGNYGGVFGKTDEIFKKNTVIDGLELGNFVLTYNFNCIGEPTTALFRKSMLIEPFGAFNGRRYGCNVDQAAWFNLLSKGKAVFINEVLSYFRIHSGQQLQDISIRLKGIVDYLHTILTCQKKGYLSKSDLYLRAAKYCLLLCEEIFNRNSNYLKNTMKEFSEFEIYYNELKNKEEEVQKEVCKSFPLVSILIPAYNQTKFLKDALESAINQTYPNIEIIIGDDSTNNEVEEFVKPYLEKHKNITYFRNERSEVDYGYINHVNCLKKSKGEYVNYLCHDDVFHPQKIEKMMKYFMEYPSITLVTSTRQPIDENGNELALTDAFSRLFDKDAIVSGNQICKYIISNLTNYIGEPTTVLFKKKYIGEKYGYFNGVRFQSISDVANWFTLLQHGDMVYISETLSYTRMHPNQNSNKSDIHVMGIISWYQLIKHSYATGIIQDLKEYKTLIINWIKKHMSIADYFIKQNDYVNSGLKDELASSFKDAVDEIIRKNVDCNKICIICGQKVERFLPYQYKKHKSDFTNSFQIIGSDTDSFACPHCQCHDRMRHIVMYFNRENIWEKCIENKKVLHIAPEMHLQQIISKYKPLEYVCGDLYPQNESIVKVDITNIPYSDNYFDFIICNHVLEHIPNDLKAMKELYRVLKKGGYAVLQTPYSPVIEKSFEDKRINSDAERLKFYGQADHVRIYGMDLFARLESVGFKLNIIKNDDLFSRDECEKYGVNYREDLILVSK